MFNLEEELKKLPSKPGVYIMHNKNDEIIYVGKAINLKNRVRQYFQKRERSSKISKMVTQIAYFEYIITDSEIEALILECNLIKEHSPKYNTMLKDGKSYPYIKITVNEEYPRVLFSRNMKRDKAKYFGPYTSLGAVKDTLELIRKIYRIRTCNRNLPRDIGKERPCLYAHLEQCMAPCMGNCNKEEYNKAIKEIIGFLNGDYADVKKYLEDEMYKASDEMDFERAAEYRDLLKSVLHISEKQKINDNNEQDDKDVIACAIDGTEVIVQVFFIRNGKMIGREHYYMKNADRLTSGEVIYNFIKQFYSGTPYLPKTLLVGSEIEERELLEEWLSIKKGSKVSIKVPIKGKKEQMLELAKKNALLVMNQDREKIQREERRTKGAVEELEKLIQIDKHIERIESYDISNISGFDSVGSMVVFENGKPKKSDYRKFRIKTVQGPNDYASMEEVLTRRFTHGLKEENEKRMNIRDKEYFSFSKYPELILMDGGRGQVNIAMDVLNKLGFDIAVCGMVKDDNHRTRGLYCNNVEVDIDTHSEVFRLITRIQDETHRFAIEYHRSLRSKGQVHSILDDIPGVGPKRRKILMKHFESIEAIKSASVEEIEQLDGMNNKIAQEIIDFFNRKK
ncbi:MAG: excinuclease ABC subunit UvrC [Lachnospiraceae bacterium]|nr:excinuclease ABC subunit UvrC [Lachnospiraceae bacterium]